MLVSINDAKVARRRPACKFWGRTKRKQRYMNREPSVNNSNFSVLSY